MEDNAHLTADAIRPSAGSAGSSSTQEISAVGGGAALCQAAGNLPAGPSAELPVS